MTADALRRPRSQQIGDLLRRSAARTPNRTALAFRDRRESYAELDRAVNRAANGLAAQGYAKGDRLAILSRNNRDFVVLRFAIARIGAVMAPVNFMLNAGDVAYILAHSGAKAIFAEDALCPTADAAIAQLDGPAPDRFVIPHDGVDAGPGWRALADVLDHPDTTEPWVEMGPEDPCQMMYTSGTESRPKGAMLTAEALYANYVSTIIGGEMRADAIELHCLPLFHCAQLDCFLTPGLYLGAVNILHDRADPAAMLEAIEKEGVTKLFCPPTVWIALLRHPDFDRRDLSSLTHGYYGASIMPTAVIEELSARLPGIRLWNFYGQTEMAPLATILGPEEQLSRLGSAGRPAVNVETRVVDDDDNPVPVGEVGEIVHRSPHLILGYHDDPEKTAEAFRNGWFHSGDLGRWDEDGYLYVVDRKKDMIKTGGENVASREVEECIFRHPAAAEAAVFGVPHPKWIEAVCAVVVLKAGESATAEEIRAYCREQLAHFKAPQHVEIAEALPKNASGKVLKRNLREERMGLFDAQAAEG